MGARPDHELGRAAQIFVIEESMTDSAIVPKVWSTRSGAHDEFSAVADPAWQMVISTQRGVRSVVLQGPNERAHATAIPPDTEFFGIVFATGTYPAGISLAGLLGRARPLSAMGRTLQLGDLEWEIPTPGNADVFADRLVRAGLIRHDRAVADALAGESQAASARTLQRRMLRATGMTRSTLEQIARAHEAVTLLGGGAAPSVVAARLGYADQPHLTRSLRRFVGQTPAQVVGTGPHWSASSGVG